MNPNNFRLQSHDMPRISCVNKRTGIPQRTTRRGRWENIQVIIYYFIFRKYKSKPPLIKKSTLFLNWEQSTEDGLNFPAEVTMPEQETLDHSHCRRPSSQPTRSLLFYKLIVSSVLQAKRLVAPTICSSCPLSLYIYMKGFGWSRFWFGLNCWNLDEMWVSWIACMSALKDEIFLG